ncbi:protein of unknown function [Taphrina deformans PYCC 5710]|uniref:Uncharacterized protein n=1 Tax=Taphrina deformans (strain PYCC 5710 / ATCC 11124 / CBS 356.35 / IMI 108563 / JCM 9778 / NBRC 8474) TaxID=1097556 RepID=R4XLJ9_TAPDE|nr:protein of unknown function [Taphrina deformans PYCC 5710]|eukprot:CCG84165.2 protein of unknown function [Taphrina deformans PYCC 5710]
MQSGPRYAKHHHHPNSYHRNELDRKVVVLGQQGVGKSSLVLRYVNSTFHENGASTIGASFLAKKIVVDNATVRLQIWDTAGQERFRSMTPMYYRGSHAAVLCYDITSMESFKKMHSWLNELRTNMPSDVLIHIVGTKLDLTKTNSTVREVPFKTSVEYAAAHFGLKFEEALELCHEVSSKDDRDGGIDALFMLITKRLILDSEATDRARSAQANRSDYTNRVHIADHTVNRSMCC